MVDAHPHANPLAPGIVRVSAVHLALLFCFTAANALAFGEQPEESARATHPSYVERSPFSHERLRRVPIKQEIRGTAPIGPNEPLTSAIHSGMSARSVAGLRIAEAGRKLLQRGHYAQALVQLEKALALDTNPYNYYYLGLVHYRLARYQQSLNFLEIADSRLSDEPEWQRELSALKAVVRHELQSSRVSAVRHDQTAIVERHPASLAKGELEQRMDTTEFSNRGSRARRYLLFFDLFVLLFLTAFLVSSLRSLKPR
jgi:hypothetical protein